MRVMLCVVWFLSWERERDVCISIAAFKMAAETKLGKKEGLFAGTKTREFYYTFFFGLVFLRVRDFKEVLCVCVGPVRAQSWAWVFVGWCVSVTCRWRDGVSRSWQNPREYDQQRGGRTREEEERKKDFNNGYVD